MEISSQTDYRTCQAKACLRDSMVEEGKECPKQLSAPLFRVECETHECIAIVDLDIEHAEQSKSEEAGDLRAFRVANAGRVEGNHVMIFLA